MTKKLSIFNAYKDFFISQVSNSRDWQLIDKSIIRKINDLIKDIHRNGLSIGIGKPEPLKHRKVWSRRINQEHRLIYKFDENKNLIILSCNGHYED